MALITKIREKSGVAAGAIAISLILFLVGSDIFQGNSSLFGGNDRTTVGEISGQTISIQEFQTRVEETQNAYTAQTGRTPSLDEQKTIREQIWNQFISEIAFQKEFEALGIRVSAEELTDMVTGENIHPAVAQQFTNPSTGELDKAYINQFLSNLKTLPIEQQKSWANFEQQLIKDRQRTKYENLIRLTNYVTQKDAEKTYFAENSKFGAKFVFVPFYTIPDSSVKISKAQMEEYLNSHKDEFQGIDSRSIKYVTFPVIPTKEDSTAFLGEVRQLAKNLATAQNDSAFAMLNSDERIPYRLIYSEIPENIKERMGEFQAGGIYGPFKNGNVYTILKYDGKDIEKNYTVRASHILIRPINASDSAKAGAKEMAQNLLKSIKEGANFESVASLNSMDGTAQVGGDLGYFKDNGSMVADFEKAVFAFKGTGLLPNIVETEFGYHIVKVTEAKTNTYYKIATINKYISASQTTLDRVYAQADEFANANTTLAAFEQALEKDSSLIMLRADRLAPDANQVNTLANARDLVRWAYDEDTQIGDGSKKVFEYENQYIVAYLTEASNKDDIKVEDYLVDLNFAVGNKLKGEKILEKLNGIGKGDLDFIAAQYGAGALVDSVQNLTIARGIMNMGGPDAVAIGMVAGLKVGKVSKPFIGDNGVYIIQKTAEDKPSALADYSVNKKQAEALMNSRSSYLINEAIKENAKIKDNRYKFY